MELYEKLLASGAKFRGSLTDEDVDQIVLARTIFQLNAVIPAGLYYFTRYGRDPIPKFPATISYTIRLGLPKWVSHLGWSAGWYLMYRVIQRRGDQLLKAFSMQMFATGIVTTAICPLGKSELGDTIHAMAACLYMLDHHALFRILDAPVSYIRVFYGAFLGMLSAMTVAKLQFKWDESNPAAQALLSSQSRLFWSLELVVMICENVLFQAFVSSMGSGLRPREQNRTAKKETPPDKKPKTQRSRGNTVIFAFFLLSLFKTIQKLKAKPTQSVSVRL